MPSHLEMWGSERSDPELYGSADDYYAALSSLNERGISPKHRRMLLSHLNAPNHIVTWEDLAKAVGYASYKIVNLQYGSLAHRLAEELGVDEPPLREVWPKGWWGYVLVDWADKRGSLGHTAYVMRPPLVAALHRLEWGSSTKPRGGSAPKTFPEGRSRDVVQSERERDPRARSECLRHYGTACVVCNRSLEEEYGDIARDFVHVHHLHPLAAAERATDPVRDLRPVCPNCHGIIHRRSPPYTIEEMQTFTRSTR
jgi:hypothetical protein